ncbi:hypothetical protein PT277_01165 [Acetobacteraceae bacterium ESL0709]|nr:hypothetical protein [Acetobacteraceae bacterium ESL0697]MDF7677315.1 hypothetical protein [Acetobacteraceae bacterium ESL0709]
MHDGPYLETCCRSALHRLFLSGDAGRPAEAVGAGQFPDFRSPLKDRPCLDNLAKLGLAVQGRENRFFITTKGKERHDREMCPTSKAQKKVRLRFSRQHSR